MIHMKATTKNVITCLESSLNDIMKDQLLHLVIRGELDRIVISFPHKLDEDGQPHWADMLVDVYCNGAFKKKYEEKDKD